jgi:hypothetical protein
MLDTLFKIGTVFDWISPTVAFVQTLINGPSYTFTVPANVGVSGGTVVDFLHRRGIKTWGHMIVNGYILFTVRQSQARWAQYQLERAGVPIGNPLE